MVLHQLTKAPFEPLKDASLKQLTFKTVFLLALASGKRRSEIRAWLHKNIRHHTDWLKVSLYPSPSFLAKNHLAREGPGSVAPVVIPTLAPILDWTLKEDRSLCLVRALRYYLDRTKDLRKDKELVLVSFKKGFDRHFSGNHCFLDQENSDPLLPIVGSGVPCFASGESTQCPSLCGIQSLSRRGLLGPDSVSLSLEIT